MDIHASRPRLVAEYGLSRLLRDTFKPGDGSTADVLDQLLHAARLYLGMEVAFISRFGGERRIFRCVDQERGLNLLRVSDSDPLDSSFCKKVVEGRLPELIHNAQTDREAQQIPATRELGIGAHVSVPIRMADGSVYGTFCSFSFHADHSLNERDLALMRVFSSIAAGLIETEMRQSREEEEKRARITALIEENGLFMVWQPIVEIASGQLIGVEALARFPRGPHSGPEQWFNEAAETGLADKLEARAIEQGLEMLQALPVNVYVACNISAATFLEPSVQALLANHPLERIVLEITEHDVIEDYAPLAEQLAPLREKGLRLAVDDAGAGYASFRHILSLRPDVIKLDMSLTRDIDKDISRRSLAASLMRFAHELGCQLVAEGVETPEELATLADLGVHKAQGFYLHRPKPRDELLALFNL